eukprot:TRINITY_DN1505_c0_g1_i1.p2 TRINITY_DN1505_c0_g1~~TRINITY_DN1505_c0_g1_i1.p2  ORF type:complete len:150 (+),score=28.78 TRINITY_DN1505_c0_g1_i1:1362-1811(+)
MAAAAQLPAMVIMASALIIVAYFSRNILRTVDVLYKPKIDPWIRDRQQSLRNLASGCKDPGSTSCKIKDYESGFKSDPIDQVIEEDVKYLKFLEEELEALRKIREEKLQNNLLLRNSIRYEPTHDLPEETPAIQETCAPRQIFPFKDEL